METNLNQELCRGVQETPIISSFSLSCPEFVLSDTPKDPSFDPAMRQSKDAPVTERRPLATGSYSDECVDLLGPSQVLVA